MKKCQLEINPTTGNKDELNKSEAELNKYLHIKEEYWKQKAGMKWFNDGDINTRLFHNYVKVKRKKIQLSVI